MENALSLDVPTVFCKESETNALFYNYRLLLKSMVASFFVSAISNRLMVASVVLENILPPLSTLAVRFNYNYSIL